MIPDRPYMKKIYTGCQKYVPFEVDYHGSKDEVKRNVIMTTGIKRKE